MGRSAATDSALRQPLALRAPQSSLARNASLPALTPFKPHLETRFLLLHAACCAYADVT
jgi:hypothetical protein